MLFGMEVSGGAGLVALFLSLISLGANWKLFLKCDQPTWATFVPGYNVVIAMRIIGRPDWHALYFLIPGFNVYFVLRTMIELAQSFGKRSTVDYVLVCLFNLFYILNLALAYQEAYQGPAYVKGREGRGFSNGLSAG